MEKDRAAKDDLSGLRHRAEQTLETGPKNVSEKTDLTFEANAHLLHELQVHQIELEIQNEELRQAQEETARALSKYADLYDFAPVGYFTFGPGGSILEVNLTGAALLCLVDKHMTILMMNRSAVDYYKVVNPQDVIGKKCHRALMGNAGGCPECDLTTVISKGRHIFYERKGIMDADRIENVYAYPIMDEDGSVASVIIRISDITDQKKFERQLVQKEKLASLGAMVSSMAHEINNPNNFISFNMPILRDYIQEMLPLIKTWAGATPGFELCHLSFPEFEQDITKLLTNIENGSKRISSVISNLRDYSGDKKNISRTWVDLTRVIDSVLTICGSIISESVTSFVKNVPEKLPSINAQPYAIEQILINFLLNASHAADKDDSWIELGITVNDENPMQVFIAVSDNGHSMDETTQSKIFDPFFTTKQSEGGAGLGLFVSHTLAERMGGRIDVTCEQGEGSSFVLVLPIGYPSPIHT